MHIRLPLDRRSTAHVGRSATRPAGLRKLGVTALVVAALCSPLQAEQADSESPVFLAGAAVADITPEGQLPMWGYGARHAMLSQGVLDPLMAKAVVVSDGTAKAAIVGMDLGRGPTAPMMQQIREAVSQQAGIEHVIIAGSHTHHGPVIELTDREGFGRGRFDDAVAYAKKLPQMLIDVILKANESLQPARMGVVKMNLDYNRNRHTKQRPKPTDPMLAVIRLDDEQGKPIAVMVNFAAHPVMTDVMLLKFSADYPGYMQRKVEASLAAPCVFLQGAAGDMSPNPGTDRHGPEAFGEALAERVLELAATAETRAPERPEIQGRVNRYLFASRTDFNNPWIKLAYGRAFFPELVRNFFGEMSHGIPAESTTLLINRELAIVTGSGEFFCNHSNRLKERAYLPHTLFVGYANGHALYFPTIEAASEGGYGADETVSPVELGAGERMMNDALKNIYAMLGRFKLDTFPPTPATEATQQALQAPRASPTPADRHVSTSQPAPASR